VSRGKAIVAGIALHAEDVEHDIRRRLAKIIES
jgi:hypothetical protein